MCIRDRIYDDRERLDGYLAAREAELLVLADETARRMLLLDTARKRLRKEENMNYNVNVKIIPQRQAACVRMILPRYEDEGLAWQTLLSGTDSQQMCIRDSNNPARRARPPSADR